VAAIRSDPSGGTNDDGRDDIPLTSKIAIASDGRHLARKKEEVWWEYTDERSGRKYYSNGTISMWGRPADVDISAAATSAASDDRSRVETASSNLVETLPTSPTSMEKRDQQGPSAEKEKSKLTTSSATKDGKRYGKNAKPLAHKKIHPARPRTKASQEELKRAGSILGYMPLPRGAPPNPQGTRGTTGRTSFLDIIIIIIIIIGKTK